MNYYSYDILRITTDYVIVALELILCGAVLSGNNFKRSKPIHRLLFDRLGMPWYYSLYLMFLIFSTPFGSFLEWWKHHETSIRQAVPRLEQRMGVKLPCLRNTLKIHFPRVTRSPHSCCLSRIASETCFKYLFVDFPFLNISKFLHNSVVETS
jgi:hypothetical protein